MSDKGGSGSSRGWQRGTRSPDNAGQGDLNGVGGVSVGVLEAGATTHGGQKLATIDLTDSGPVRSNGHRPKQSGPVDRRPARVGTSRVDVLALVALIGAVAWLARTNIGPALSLGAAVFAAVFVAGRRLSPHDKRAAVLAAAVAASICDYLIWRARVINWDQPWLSLPLYGAEVFAALHVLGFHYTLWPREPVALADDEDPTRRPVFILVPTVDEGTAVLGATLQGAMAARARYLSAYPHGQVEIVVCNDGGVAGAACCPAVQDLCAGLDICCVTRNVAGGAKAGNLEHARQRVGATGDALIVIFDADQVAEPDFLVELVPSFRDSSVGWVQTGQYYRNVDNPVARWANDQQAIFYRVLCPGKAAGNAAFICGTNVVIRAQALDEIGGFPTKSVTEDFAASIVLHQYWRSVFVPGILAQGLGPVELGSYLGQQRRWARGTLGVLRSHWRHIFLPSRRRGLDPEQRVQYALAGTHYLSGFRDLVYLVVPLVFLSTGIPAISGANLSQFVAHFLPYLVLTQIAFWHAAWGKSTLRGIMIGFGSFPVLALATLGAVVSGGGSFKVTAKHRVGGRVFRHVVLHVVCLIACGGALWLALTRRSGAATVISALWVCYAAILLAAFVGLAALDAIAARGRVLPSWHALARWRFTSARRRSAWLAIGATAVTVGTAAFAIGVVPSNLGARRTLAVANGAADSSVGLDLTTDLVARGTAPVESLLGYRFGIVGRTQEISDHFDHAWASTVARGGARPWVTLLFTTPGQPAARASLPSVANGVHDRELRRWAREIRRWGGPVDLTILQHVDRDWVVTSAVANAGIPQDVARAWAHVRTVFRESRAHNVTWIWAPADPASDRPYAPAPGSYDAVLLSLIEYPGTTWHDPDPILARVRENHPLDSLLVETSLAGPETERLAWLHQLGQALSRGRNVSALLYHEGGPAPAATPAERASWSLSGNPLLTAAFDAAAHAASTAKLDRPSSVRAQ